MAQRAYVVPGPPSDGVYPKVSWRMCFWDETVPQLSSAKHKKLISSVIRQYKYRADFSLGVSLFGVYFGAGHYVTWVQNVFPMN